MTDAVRLEIAHGERAAERMSSLIDGSVPIDGCELRFHTLASGEMLFRAFDDPQYNVSELSLSNYISRLEDGTCAYIALPIYNYRAFKHRDGLTAHDDRDATRCHPRLSSHQLCLDARHA